MIPPEYLGTLCWNQGMSMLWCVVRTAVAQDCMQELLELSEDEIQARVTARKPAAKLMKAVQHLQRAWLQVIPNKCKAQFQASCQLLCHLLPCLAV